MALGALQLCPLLRQFADRLVDSKLVRLYVLHVWSSDCQALRASFEHAPGQLRKQPRHKEVDQPLRDFLIHRGANANSKKGGVLLWDGHDLVGGAARHLRDPPRWWIRFPHLVLRGGAIDRDDKNSCLLDKEGAHHLDLNRLLEEERCDHMPDVVVCTARSELDWSVAVDDRVPGVPESCLRIHRQETRNRRPAAGRPGGQHRCDS
mmetsp:Transcript_27972/g.63283  ORF Transcript_27972/g.63283 Transcript_27972/m.63283 type:complete len:206 (+) Transcript_27972:244-861(+)